MLVLLIIIINVRVRVVTILKKLFFTLFVFMSVALGLSQHAFASSYYTTGSTGVDASYPNCSTPIPKSDYGIVGVTGGVVYSQNNCAAAEASHFSDLSLYVNTGLNTSQSSTYYTKAQDGCNGDASCAAYNYGYNAAQTAIDYAKGQNLSSSKWWLDVETMNTWSNDTAQNQKSIQGQYDAMLNNGAIMVGVYSTTAQWQAITGGWKNNWPSWGATTWSTAKQASAYCTGHEFTGGLSLLMQFQPRKSKLDQDVAC